VFTLQVKGFVIMIVMVSISSSMISLSKTCVNLVTPTSIHVNVTMMLLLLSMICPDTVLIDILFWLCMFLVEIIHGTFQHFGYEISSFH